MSETWKPVVGYEGIYEVSDLGRVRSLDRIDAGGQKRRGVVLQPKVTPKGYHDVTLANGPRETRRVHRLVLTAFVSPPPPGLQARHLDGDPASNALPNLKWGTAVENNRDRVLHGTHPELLKTHCPSGHPYAGENLYTHPTTGHRSCVQCRRDRQERDREPLRAAALERYHANPEVARERARQYRAKKKAA